MKKLLRASAAVLPFIVATMAAPVLAQDTAGLFGNRVASVTYGPYVRLDFGYANASPDNGFWQPPGFPGDPQVNFDLDGDDGGVGSLAIGFDWLNGFRGDVSLLATGSTSVSGPCSSASDATPCSTHADITSASVRTRALMGNLFYSPLEQRGSTSVFQPFLVAGLGVARNEVGQWTRENPAAARPTRTFESGKSTEFAWSLGVGASLQLTAPGEQPVIVEASWRYYDFGEAVGGSAPVAGSGSSSPVQSLTFNNRQQVISLGVRIPLKRY